MKNRFCLVLALAALASFAPRTADAAAATARRHAGSVTVQKTPYPGWQDSYVLNNGIVEVVIIPAIGRIMDFHFIGHAGPFWANSAMSGKNPDPKASEWGNFGGDKTWPAPQAEWGKITGRQWPPPPAFDSMPVKTSIIGHTVELVTPVDPAYGIRARRRISLDPRAAVMRVTTRYEKVQGEPRKVGVWTITQTREPVDVYIRLPQNSMNKDGYVRMEKGDLPANLKVEDSQNGAGRVISLTRDAGKASKIGTDGGTLLWVGEDDILRMDSPRLNNPAAEYPDQGSSAEVYTSPNPLQYVELEMLGPLVEMKTGDHIERTTTYTLMHRRAQDARAEALQILAKP